MSEKASKGSREKEALDLKKQLVQRIGERIEAGVIPQTGLSGDRNWIPSHNGNRSVQRTFVLDSGVRLTAERIADYALIIRISNATVDQELEGMLKAVSEQGALEPGRYWMGTLEQRETRDVTGVGIITSGTYAGKSWPTSTIAGGIRNWEGFDNLDSPGLALKVVEMIPAQPLTEAA